MSFIEPAQITRKNQNKQQKLVKTKFAEFIDLIKKYEQKDTEIACEEFKMTFQTIFDFAKLFKNYAVSQLAVSWSFNPYLVTYVSLD